MLGQFILFVEQVKRLEIGALVSIRGISRVYIIELMQVSLQTNSSIMLVNLD